MIIAVFNQAIDTKKDGKEEGDTLEFVDDSGKSLILFFLPDLVVIMDPNIER